MCYESGYSIRGRRSVTQIPTHARAALNLNATDQRDGIHQSRVSLGDRGVFINLTTGHRSSEPKPVLRIIGNFIEFGNVLGIDEHVQVAAMFPDLHNDVRASGKQSGSVAQFGKNVNRIGEGTGSAVFDIFQG